MKCVRLFRFRDEANNSLRSGPTASPSFTIEALADKFNMLGTNIFRMALEGPAPVLAK